MGEDGGLAWSARDYGWAHGERGVARFLGCSGWLQAPHQWRHGGGSMEREGGRREVTGVAPKWGGSSRTKIERQGR